MFNPQDYNININDPVGALMTATKEYEELVQSLKISSTNDNGPIKEVFETWRENAPELDLDKGADSMSGPELLAAADHFAELARQYKDYADTAARESLGQVIGKNVRNDKREDAEGLRKVVESLYGMLKPMGLVPDEFPVKQSKSGEMIPDLSKNAHKPHAARS